MLAFICSCLNTTKQADLSIIVLEIRLRLQLQIQKSKSEGLKAQALLVQQIKKSPGSRNKSMEELYIKQITDCCSRSILYQYLCEQCRKIQQYKHFLNDKKNFHLIEKNIKMLLYCENVIKLPALQQFAKQANRKYPDLQALNEKEIEENLILHYKTSRQPSHSMMSQYILQLCVQQNLSLEQINMVGHNFKYGQNN